MIARDIFRISTTAPTTTINEAQADVENIKVVPNPYYGTHDLQVDRFDKYVTFTHLPERATIRIFNLAGVLVRVIEKNDLSQLVWSTD